jgi:hypothetical protein
MRVQVIERAICLLATLPATFVHSLDFFISTTGTLVLLGTGNWDEGINLLKLLSEVRHETAPAKQKRHLVKAARANIPVQDGLLQ